MRFATKTILAALLWSGAAAAAPPAPVDRVEMERLAADNDAAWTAKDWARITGQYAASGTLRVGPAAPVELGREAIGRFFQAAFARRPEGFRHVTDLLHIEMVTPDLAIADGHVRVERAEGEGWALVREFSSSSLVIREGGAWKLHSVRAHPLPQKTS